jgi:hypothetical protein
MARFRFEDGSKYPARLYSVCRRPVENRDVGVIRLEFELFRWNDAGDAVKSTGKIACREIVASIFSRGMKDDGAKPYMEALAVKTNAITEWMKLDDQVRWVALEFGKRRDSDGRNSFRSITGLKTLPTRVSEYRRNDGKEWGTVQDAADLVGCSKSTVIRKLKTRLALSYGANLAYRTNARIARFV